MSDTLNRRYKAAGNATPNTVQAHVDAADAAVDLEAAVAAIPSWLIKSVPHLATDVLVDLILDAALGRRNGRQDAAVNLEAARLRLYNWFIFMVSNPQMSAEEVDTNVSTAVDMVVDAALGRRNE